MAKILLFDNSSLTSTENGCCVEPKTGQFASELKKLGHNVTMYGQIVDSKNTVHTYNLKHNEIDVKGLKRKSNKLINYIMLYAYAIPQILKSDFIYIFYPTTYKFIPFLCWCFRKKYGIYLRGMQGVNDKLSIWNYNNSKVVFTVSKYFTDMIKSKITHDKVFTIRPMIPYTDKDIVNGRNYEIGEKIRILFLGRVTYDKGVEELLNALKILIERNHKIELKIVGSGEFISTAKSFVELNNLEESVVFVGPVFDKDLIKDYYINADIFILPTYHEGFPRTLYEAMIFGTPIITTFVGGIPSLMKDDWNCVEIIPKSVNSIVEKIEYSIENYDKMKYYAINGTNTVREIVDSRRLTHSTELNHIIISI